MAIKNYLSTQQRVAKILLDIKAVTISPKKPYIFTSGIVSPIYTDNRLLMGHPLKRKEIILYIAYLLKEKGIDPEVIAGTSTAGIAPAAFLSELLVLPMVYVRGEKKAHGKGKQVEGIMEKGSEVLLVEDLISTGKSSLAAIDAIRSEGGKCNTCVAFIDYGLKDTAKKYKDLKVDLFTLTTFEVLVEMAEKLNLIAHKEKAVVLEWNKDPWGWGKKAHVAKEKEQSTDY